MIMWGFLGQRNSTQFLEVTSGHLCFPGGSVVKNLPASAEDPRDLDLIPGSGRFLGIGNGNPLQCSCLENSMERGAWGATVHGVSKSWTQLSDSEHTHMQSERTYLWYLVKNMSTEYAKICK